MRLGLVMLGIAVLLMAGCARSPAATSTPTTLMTGPTPLQWPNGAPPDEDLRGLPIPVNVLVDGEPYALGKTLAHVDLSDDARQRPAFLTPIGDAVMATLESGEYIPAPGAVYPAFSLAATPADQTVVLRFTRVGAANRYWVFVRYERV